MKRKKISKEEILEAAKSLFLEQGYEATSIRKIASRIGISPTTIYLYYKGKTEIVHALHSAGFELLNKKFETLHLVEEPFERLKAMGRCYIDFAIDHKGFYEIMFIMKEPLKYLQNAENPTCNSDWEEGKTAFHALISTIEDCMNNGYFKHYDSHTLALLIWSHMHGLCTLNNNGQLGLVANKTNSTIQETENILKQSFEVYSQMLKNI